MTFTSEIYRRLDFGISILDEPDERISVQETEVSILARKRRISIMICPKRTQILFLSREGSEKKSAYENKKTKVKELTKMLKMMLLVPTSFSSSGG